VKAARHKFYVVGILFMLVASACTAPAVSPTLAPTIAPVAATATPVPATAVPMPTSTAAEPASATPRPFEDVVHLFDYEASVPLDIQEVNVTESQGVTTQDITFAGVKGDRVSVFLITPRGSGPFAGIVFQTGCCGMDREYFLEEAQYLATRGVVSLVFATGYTAQGKPEDQDRAIQAVVNLRRGIDLLAARPDVDKNRIAFVGVSDGANLGGMLAAVDKRLVAYVLMSGGGHLYFGDNDFRVTIQDPAERATYAALMAEIDPGRLVSHAAPATLFFQAGHQDFALSGMQGLLTLYQTKGSEPKTITWYEADHFLNSAARDDREEWLSTKLSLPPAS
jgi:dienelactone hydrolase